MVSRGAVSLRSSTVFHAKKVFPPFRDGGALLTASKGMRAELRGGIDASRAKGGGRRRPRIDITRAAAGAHSKTQSKCLNPERRQGAGFSIHCAHSKVHFLESAARVRSSHRSA